MPSSKNDIVQSKYANELFNLSLDLFCVADLNGHFLEINPAWTSTLGWELSELTERPYFDFIHPDDQERTRVEAEQLAQGNVTVHFENRYLHKQGGYRELLWNARANIKAGLIFAVARDMTVLKERQMQLVASARLSSVGEMAAGIAHEINNPLAIIHGRAYQMRRRLVALGKDFAEVFGDLDIIEKTTQRIVNIVSGLRVLSRGGDSEEPRLANLNRVIEETLSVCRERFLSHGIKLRFQADDSVDLEFRAVQIAQVLLNLLNNAFDAVKDTKDPWVEVCVAKRGHQAKITVTDSGLGIPPKIASRIMEPFFTTKSAGNGTGLGLSISRRIIESHNGRLFLETNAPHTQFVIELPL